MCVLKAISQNIFTPWQADNAAELTKAAYAPMHTEQEAAMKQAPVVLGINLTQDASICLMQG